ncbi:ferredoxin family protein [Halanaerobaculum tunisiense]
MSNFSKNEESPLKYVTIKAAKESHISIRDSQICRTECENKPCTYYCPTRVYSWNGEKNKIRIDHTRCVECMACPYGCPYQNINWEFPAGGYGVNYYL